MQQLPGAHSVLLHALINTILFFFVLNYKDDLSLFTFWVVRFTLLFVKHEMKTSLEVRLFCAPVLCLCRGGLAACVVTKGLLYTYKNAKISNYRYLYTNKNRLIKIYLWLLYMYFVFANRCPQRTVVM